MAETEEEERDAKYNANNAAMDNFIQSPVRTKTPRNIAKVQNERQIYSDSLAETINGFKRLTLQSTINDSADYHSDENDAESDLNSDQLVDTHTSDGKKKTLILRVPTEILHTNY